MNAYSIGLTRYIINSVDRETLFAICKFPSLDRVGNHPRISLFPESLHGYFGRDDHDSDLPDGIDYFC